MVELRNAARTTIRRANSRLARRRHALIREKSGGRKSLDDFAKSFFGVEDGNWSEDVYTFDDIVTALNKVEPYDWAKFLNERINRVAPQPPLDGLARGGWKLIYTETPTDYFKSAEARRKSTDLTYSLGLVLGRDADITQVQWDGPAFKAGLTVGLKLLAVNGIAYDADRLKEAVTEAKKGWRLTQPAGQERGSLQNRRDQLPRRPALPAP